MLSTAIGDTSPYYGIFLRAAFMPDTVYINHTLVDATTIVRQLDLLMPRHYYIPSAVLKKRKNDLYIRFGSYGMQKGSIKSDVIIQTRNDFNKAEFRDAILYKYKRHEEIF